jgi:hypothetical protein
MCPHCDSPLFGSASRGKLGKYYPAYHCNKRGHYFRVPQKQFDETIRTFIQNLQVSPDYADALTDAVVKEWDKRQTELHKDDQNVDAKIAELKTQASLTVDKIRFLSSEVAIKHMEEVLVNIDQQIKDLEADRLVAEAKKPTDIQVVMAYIKHFMQNLEYLLLEQANPLRKLPISASFSTRLRPMKNWFLEHKTPLP